MKVFIEDYPNSHIIKDFLEGLKLSEEAIDKIEDHIPQFVYNYLNRDRKIQVQISNSDVWSLDHTLACIIKPALEKFKKKTNGFPDVDLEDVPEYLQFKPEYRTYWTYYKGQLHIKEFKIPKEPIKDIGYKRWLYILDEMIFAFNSKLIDWEDKYHSGKYAWEWKNLDNGYSQLLELPESTHKFDTEGWLKEQERITNGFRLFGKYYEALWI